MRHAFTRALLFVAVIGLLAGAASADSIPVGIFSFDVTGLNTLQFDITNQTGPNSSPFPDTTFPVTSSVFLSSLSMTVNFANGTTQTFGSSYFTLGPDGLSFSGNPLSTLNAITSATLTGKFSTTTFNLNNGTSVTVLQGFTVTITDSTGGPLQDGDFGIINATTGTSTTPEPETWTLMGTGLASLLAFKRKYLGVALRRLLSTKAGITNIAIGLCCLLLVLSTAPGAMASTATVQLNKWTNPPSGAAGASNVYVTGSGFPSGTISPSAVTISIAKSCFGGSPTTTKGLLVTHILGTSDRIEFLIPGSITTTGNYFVWISGKTTTGTAFASSNCSEVTVTATTKALTCLPSSSIGLLTGTTTVQAYVPNGDWGSSTTGVQFVPIEGGGSTAAISTASSVNSCSSNSVTGQSVCVANNTDVYLITGSTLNKTLTSGSNSSASFSGGSCENCGVAIDPLTNTAFIEMGFTPSGSGDAIQALNLNNNTFAAPTAMANRVSENIAVDPTRNLIMSPDESGIYDLVKIGAGGTLTEFANNTGVGTLDSAAEDCSTGIALSSLEFSDQVFITDLTQAKFTSGSPGTWTAPSQAQNFPDFENFAAGTDGIAVAPGTSHLGIVTGEFGGNQFGVLQLPKTAGSGTPAIGDWAGAAIPNTPDGVFFSAGFDPHTITAYTSPNNQKAYGVIADWALGTPSFLAIIDLQALLAAPRKAGVDAGGSPCSTCTHSVDPSYDLVAHGVIRFVKTK
jgi:hypothetical protein